MRILVTGSGGFIGKSLLELLFRDGHFVVAMYRHRRPEVSEFASDRLRLLRADLSGDLPDLPPVDLIIHAAAHTHLIPNSRASDYIQSNVIGMQNLADYARRVKPQLFINFSTLSVYGAVAVDELNEDTPLNKPGMYGLSKYMGEMILGEYAEYFPSICIRLPGVVGPDYFTPWIGTVVRKAALNEAIEIYNPDNDFNNIVDIVELHRFISWVAGRDYQGCDCFNFAAANPLPIRKVVDLILALTDSKSDVQILTTDRPSFVIQTSKLKQVFGFQPAATEEMTRRYVTDNLPTLKQLAVAG